MTKIRLLLVALIIFLIGWIVLGGSRIQPQQVAEKGEPSDRLASKAQDVGTASNRPIHFFGKILDQNGKPVSSVKVQIHVSYFGAVLPGLMPSKKIIDRVSDVDGRFSLEAESGLSIGIRLLAQEGYKFKDEGALGVSFRDDMREVDAAQKTWDNPYVFYAFRRGTAEPLVRGAVAFYQCVPDGRFYYLNFRNKEISSDAGGGNLRMSVQRPAGQMDGKSYDWTFFIEGIQSEVLETTDPFMYEAPSTGYTPSWKFVRRAGDPNYVRSVSPKFYLKAVDGSAYGRVEVSVTSNYGEKAAIRVKYAVNPAGSRNLQPDSNW